MASEKTTILLSLITAAATPVVAHAQELSITLHPGEKIEGSDLDYDLIWNSIQLNTRTPYGSPFLVQINETLQTTSLDVSYSQFDGFVVRVPLDRLLLQPNREGVDSAAF